MLREVKFKLHKRMSCNSNVALLAIGLDSNSISVIDSEAIDDSKQYIYMYYICPLNLKSTHVITMPHATN